MSFEGYWQYWCPNGHYWTSGYTYGEPSDGHICDECGQEAIRSNLVDDTNCNDFGRIFDEKTIPTFCFDDWILEEYIGTPLKMKCCNGHIREVTIKNRNWRYICHHHDGNRECGAPFSKIIEPRIYE